jgi:hypothetical protein
MWISYGPVKICWIVSGLEFEWVTLVMNNYKMGADAPIPPKV